MEPALTQIIHNKNEAGPQDDSDFEDKLQNKNNIYQITQTLSRAVIREILKN
jgi:hypothetical protein